MCSFDERNHVDDFHTGSFKKYLQSTIKMGFRNSEANAASRETENVTSFQVREQNVEMQKLRKPFTKDKFSPPEMAFFVGG